MSHLTRGNQRRHGHEAAVARGEIGAQPEVAEEIVGRVADEAGRHVPELIADIPGALRLGGFVQRPRLNCLILEFIHADTALREHRAHRRGRRHRSWALGLTS
ncbi:MAG: hypothetical protein WAU49_10750 [Steroidobacteraceae bacterium]